MPTPVIPLMQFLVEVPDFRAASGKRHPLSAILALACAAILCGYRSYGAMAEWGRNYGAALVAALGFTRSTTPCAATLHTVFKHLDVDCFEAKLGAWAEQALAAQPCTAEQLEALACDGKTLRGSRKLGAPGSQLLATVSQRLGLTLSQCAVAAGSSEQSAMQDLLTGLLLTGRVITADALHTQREFAQAVLDAGGDYILFVKDNQPQLREDIAPLFQEPQVVAETLTTARTLDLAHGRIEERRLTASWALIGYTDWPGLQQVFQLQRTSIIKKTGQQRHETVYGVTSLSTQQADATRLLHCSRDHWRIEASHWIRNVTFDEDRSQVRGGHIPQVMAALRNTTIALMRMVGETNIAAATRRYAAQPWAALALIGITREN
jgi:predicted transposase YbfD/YdcC